MSKISLIFLTIILIFGIAGCGTPEVLTVPTASLEEAVSTTVQDKGKDYSFALDAEFNKEWSELLGRNVYIQPAALNRMNSGLYDLEKIQLVVRDFNAVLAQDHFPTIETLDRSQPHTIIVLLEDPYITVYEETHHNGETFKEGRVSFLNLQNMEIYEPASGLTEKQSQTMSFAHGMIQALMLGSADYSITIDFSTNQATQQFMLAAFGCTSYSQELLVDVAYDLATGVLGESGEKVLEREYFEAGCKLAPLFP